MHKVTAAAAIIFMLTCMGLTLHFGRGETSSIMEGVTQTEAPVATEVPISGAQTPDVQPQDAQPSETQAPTAQPPSAPETQTEE